MRRRVWFRVHSFIGVIGGLLLFVLCWSGAIATVSHEIDWLLTPALRVEPRTELMSLDRLHASVMADYPNATVHRIHAPLHARAAAHAVVDLPDQRLVRVYVDPYTAAMLGRDSYFSVQRFFRSFHIHLFNGQWGLYLVWLLAVPLFASVIAPLVFYRRWWTRLLDLKAGRGARAFWSGLHKLAGVWTLWFAMIIAITSAWFLFEAVRYDFIDGKNAWVGESASAVNRLPELPAGPVLPIKDLLARAMQARPELEIKTIGFSRRGYFYLEGQASDWLVRDRANKLYLDPRNGAVVYDQRASNLSAYWRWSDTADPLHFGDFGGLKSKLVWLAFGVLMSGLCLTGAYLHAARLAADVGRHKRARWPGTAAAAVASLLVLAASMRGGWIEIKRYGATAHGVQQWPDVPPGVTTFIAAWVLLTLAALAWWLRTLRRATARSEQSSPRAIRT
jgi:uncharacterized iron-regulated membrane protein